VTTYYRHTDSPAFDQFRVPPSSSSTFQASYIRLDVSASPNTLSEEERAELEWEYIVNKPRVRNGIRRLAAEARRQREAGETEEGGFAVE